MKSFTYHCTKDRVLYSVDKSDHVNRNHVLKIITQGHAAKFFYVSIGLPKEDVTHEQLQKTLLYAVKKKIEKLSEKELLKEIKKVSQSVRR